MFLKNAASEKPQIKSKNTLEAIEEVSRRWVEREIEDTTTNKTS